MTRKRQGKVAYLSSILGVRSDSDIYPVLQSSLELLHHLFCRLLGARDMGASACFARYFGAQKLGCAAQREEAYLGGGDVGVG